MTGELLLIDGRGIVRAEVALRIQIRRKAVYQHRQKSSLLMDGLRIHCQAQYGPSHEVSGPVLVFENLRRLVDVVLQPCKVGLYPLCQRSGNHYFGRRERGQPLLFTSAGGHQDSCKQQGKFMFHNGK